MAAPMRSGHQQDGQGHRARVADSCKGATAARGPNQPSAGQPQQHHSNQPTATTANFEYDDNEWDIGIGDLIIDLDADIEKTNEQQQPINSNMATNTGNGPQASKAAATAKMHIEHSATTDKGLKMKIKRTKPGTKTSEAKHEIVKSNEQNGVVDPSDLTKGPPSGPGGNKHIPSSTVPSQPSSANVLSGNVSQNLSSGPSASQNTNSVTKRGSSGHRRDKTSRDKHADRNIHNSSASSGSTNASSQPTSGSSSSSSSSSTTGEKLPNKSSLGGGPGGAPTPTSFSGAISSSTDMNGLLRAASVPQPGPPRSVFPASTGPGPPPPSPGPPASPAAATAQGSAAKPEQSKVGVTGSANANSGHIGGSAAQSGNAGQDDHRTNSTSPPPSKKAKTEPKVTNVPWPSEGMREIRLRHPELETSYQDFTSSLEGMWVGWCLLGGGISLVL